MSCGVLYYDYLFIQQTSPIKETGSCSSYREIVMLNLFRACSVRGEGIHSNPPQSTPNRTSPKENSIRD
jgi:hypothetical protein